VTAAAARVDELGNRIEKALEDADLPGTTAAIRDLSGGVGRTAGEYERLGRDFRHGLDGVWSTFASVRRLAEMLERDPASLVHGKTPTEIRRD